MEKLGKSLNFYNKICLGIDTKVLNFGCNSRIDMHMAGIGHRNLNFRASMEAYAKIENYDILEKFKIWVFFHT
jgi:hypothetical protein